VRVRVSCIGVGVVQMSAAGGVGGMGGMRAMGGMG
jgi:hypothetical protein